MAIVTDDTKTAVAYFAELKREVKDKVTVKIIPAPHDGASPDAVVNLAIGVANELAESHDPEDRTDSVWALLDLEAEPARQSQAYSAKKKGEASGIAVALSKPCFESWTLAHLLDTGEDFLDCGAVIQSVKSEWQRAFGIPFGDKAQADYSKLRARRGLAIARARKRASDTDQSWTEVYQAVEAILAYVP